MRSSSEDRANSPRSSCLLTRSASSWIGFMKGSISTRWRRSSSASWSSPRRTSTSTGASGAKTAACGDALGASVNAQIPVSSSPARPARGEIAALAAERHDVHGPCRRACFAQEAGAVVSSSIRSAPLVKGRADAGHEAAKEAKRHLPALARHAPDPGADRDGIRSGDAEAGRVSRRQAETSNRRQSGRSSTYRPAGAERRRGPAPDRRSAPSRPWDRW